MLLPFCLCCQTLLQGPHELPPALPGAENELNHCNSTKGGLSFQTNRARKMLFDVLSGSAVLGDQPEGDGLANTTVPLQQDDLSLSQSARLCTCRHFLQFVAKG